MKNRNEDLGDNVTDSDRKAHNDACSRIISKAVESAGGVASKPKPLERVATQDIVSQLDCMLRKSLKRSWADFNGRDGTPSTLLPLYKRPRATILLDSVNENACFASWSLNHMQDRTSFMFDPIHRLTRCLWGAVKYSGLSSQVYMGTVISSADRGPFKSEDNRNICREWATEHLGLIKV